MPPRRRTALRRASGSRDWTDPRAKVEQEGCCRVCGSPTAVEAAHLIARSQTQPGAGEHPLNIVPLCRRCHRAYDMRRLDLLPYLSVAEQAKAVELASGIVAALRRV